MPKSGHTDALVIEQCNQFGLVFMILVTKIFINLGGSPGIVVMGRDSHSKGHGFESRHRILDGHFFTYICCKNCNDVCLKRPKINEKEAAVGPFKKILINAKLPARKCPCKDK